MKNPKSLILILAACFFSLSGLRAQGPGDPLAGQDTLVLENERIEDVIDSDKPTLRLPFQTITQAPVDDITYESRDFYVETDFKPAPPRIQELKPPKPNPLMNNFLKVGLGRFITPLVKVSLSNGREGAFDYGLDLTHLSAHNDALRYRQFREDYGTLRGTAINGNNNLSGLLHLYNTSYFNYADTVMGGDVDVYEDRIRMAFTRVNLEGRVASNYDPDATFAYDAGLGFRVYTGRRKNTEIHIQLTPKIEGFLTREVSIGILPDITYVRAQIDSVDQNRFLLRGHPFLRFQNDELEVQGGVNVNYFNNSIDSSGTFSLVPTLEVAYKLIPEVLTLKGGITGGMTHNHFYGMIGENRFLATAQEIRPTVEKLNIYGGVSGNIGQKADFAGKLYYRKVKNQLIWFTPENGAYFTALYDTNMSVVGTHLELNYDVLTELRAGVAVDINGYSTSNITKYFQASPLRVKMFGEYTLNDKLQLNGELFLFGQTPMTVDAMGAVINRKAFADMNLSADFRVTPRISLFLEANNLFSMKYQRWWNYDERPIDFKGGATFIF
jgi:hypothetical protein